MSFEETLELLELNQETKQDCHGCANAVVEITTQIEEPNIWTCGIFVDPSLETSREKGCRCKTNQRK